MKEFATVKTKQSKMDCRFHGNDRQMEIGSNLPKDANLRKVYGQLGGLACPGVPSESRNHSGKKFTGILPKSRFFG